MIPADPDEPLQTTVARADEASGAILTSARTSLQRVEAFQITSNEHAAELAEFGKMIAKQRVDNNEERLRDFVRPLELAIKNINAKYAPGIQAMTEVETKIKAKLNEWGEKERQRELADKRERQRLEDEARKERERLEREQREAEQKRIDAEKAEADAKAKLEQAAQSASDVDAALDAMDTIDTSAADADKAREEEAAKQREVDDAKERQKTALRAPAPAPAVPMSRATGGAAKTRGTWKFVLVDPAKVPREYCAPVDSLVRNAVKSAETRGELRLDADGEPVVGFAIEGVQIRFERSVTW